MRGQGTYVSDDEIKNVVKAVSVVEPEFVKELVALKPAGSDTEKGENPWKNRGDDLYEAAIDVIVREGRGSVSLLQRALGVGYGRGARLIDFMAEDGIVGPYNGSQAREVLISVEEWESLYKGATVVPKQPSAPASKPAKRGPIKPEPIADEDDEAEQDEYEDDLDDSDEDPADQDDEAEDDAVAEADEEGDDWDAAPEEIDDEADDEGSGGSRRSRTA